MRKIAVLACLLTSSTAWAGLKDLRILDAMTRIGVSGIVVGDQIVTKIHNVACVIRQDTPSSRCSFDHNIEADADTTTSKSEKIHWIGVDANELALALVDFGASSFQARNGIGLRLSQVECVRPFRRGDPAVADEMTCTYR